jgi:hypothetical protein
MENPNTLITRFYGMHRVKMAHLKTEMHFVIMASVFNTPKEIHLRFDLKGSKVGRSATAKDKANKNGVLKDNDLVQEKIHVSLGQEKRAMMLEQLRKDVAFLKRMKIMDYSLLIGIHDSRQEILAADALVLPYDDTNETHENKQRRFLDACFENRDQGLCFSISRHDPKGYVSTISSLLSISWKTREGSIWIFDARKDVWI